MNTDQHWELHAKTNPYFAVVTRDEFRKLTPEAIRRFFETGATYIADLQKIIHAHVAGDFSPQSALDFGCGVGRLLIPLARICSAVVGVDVSPTMLAECSKNLVGAGLRDVELHRSLDLLPSDRTFDFVHSFIVLQHIPHKRGVEMFAKLLDRVADGGIAALHVTFRDGAKIQFLKQDALNRLKASLIAVPAVRRLVELLRGKPLTPPMLMQNYSLNTLFHLLLQMGFTHTYTRFTQHGVPGIILIAQRSSAIHHSEPF